MKKVWVEAGCIVCRACERICPEVFVVTEETAVIRDDADLDDMDTVREAQAACPVEVIQVKG